jgi:hypothetical protein
MAPQIMATAQQQPAIAQPQDVPQVTTQPYQQPQAVTSAPVYNVVEASPEEQKTIQLYVDNGYKDVAMVVDTAGQRLLRSRAPLDSDLTYKPLG